MEIREIRVDGERAPVGTRRSSAGIDVHEVQARRQAGATISQLMAEFDIARPTVYRLLNRAAMEAAVTPAATPVTPAVSVRRAGVDLEQVPLDALLQEVRRRLRGLEGVLR